MPKNKPRNLAVFQKEYRIVWAGTQNAVQKI